jgi:hypothetical protein
MLKIVECFPITMSEFFAIDPSRETQVFLPGPGMR